MTFLTHSTHSAATSAALSRRHGKRVLLYFVLFFGLIIVVNIILVRLALGTFSGTVSTHPYEDGLAYNRVIAAEKAQAALGFTHRAHYANGALHLTLRDAKGAVLTPHSAHAQFRRPAQKGHDVSATLTGEITPISLPLKGVWDVQIDAEILHNAAPQHYQVNTRIVVP